MPSWNTVRWFATGNAPAAACALQAVCSPPLRPFLAGLLLFDFSSDVFIGWLSALVFGALGSLGATVVLAVQLGSWNRGWPRHSRRRSSALRRLGTAIGKRPARNSLAARPGRARVSLIQCKRLHPVDPLGSSVSHRQRIG